MKGQDGSENLWTEGGSTDARVKQKTTRERRLSRDPVSARRTDPECVLDGLLEAHRLSLRPRLFELGFTQPYPNGIHGTFPKGEVGPVGVHGRPEPLAEALRGTQQSRRSICFIPRNRNRRQPFQAVRDVRVVAYL